MACYPDAIKALVLSIPPGITDKAFIECRNENSLFDASANPDRTYVEEILPIKISYYAEYAQRHSILGDLRIILRTLKAIIS